jgi:DMSO/TMAO reductase YedYZ molybdopterin-dependent catalytic subunit
MNVLEQQHAGSVARLQPGKVMTHNTIDVIARHGKDTRMRLQSEAPLNIETALDALEGAITPYALFFVRNNDSYPRINQHDWTLTIDGLVDHPFSIGYDELRRIPSESYVAVLECSGNSRSRFAGDGREAEGVAWNNGAVGNAEWVGVPVRRLLERACVQASALQAECIGGDDGRTTRGVEIAKLMDDALLAYAMNGAPLPHIHGGPVRLVVPGWGGINWIKWITGLRVIAGESQSVYNQQKYVVLDQNGHTIDKVREIKVKSVIASTPPDATLTPGSQTVRGFAWSPDGGVQRVEVSTDGGQSWHDARLLADLGSRSWRQWEWEWDAAPGEYTLACRATDLAGNTQPADVPFNQQGYGMNAIHRVPVRVADE